MLQRTMRHHAPLTQALRVRQPVTLSCMSTRLSGAHRMTKAVVQANVDDDEDRMALQEAAQMHEGLHVVAVNVKKLRVSPVPSDSEEDRNDCLALPQPTAVDLLMDAAGKLHNYLPDTNDPQVRASAVGAGTGAVAGNASRKNVNHHPTPTPAHARIIALASSPHSEVVSWEERRVQSLAPWSVVLLVSFQHSSRLDCQSLCVRLSVAASASARAPQLAAASGQSEVVLRATDTRAPKVKNCSLRYVVHVVCQHQTTTALFF